MSPTRRPSSVDGLRRAMAAPSVSQPPAEARSAAPLSKPVRVTLNLPPELFRKLTRWADQAADQLAVPRVSVQDTLSAMVAAGVADASPSSPVLAELRRSASA
jgi:hypothetical protein